MKYVRPPGSFPVASYPDDPHPPPYPYVPPEIVPRPDPSRTPPVPTVGMPESDLRSRLRERLLERRTVVLEGPLDAETATLAAAQVMTLDTDDGGEPITLLVNSPGGPPDAVTGLLDTIDLLEVPLDTTCLGQAIGTAALVVAAGTGRRRAGASAMFRLRFPDREMTGSADRLTEELEQARWLNDILLDRLASATGQERRLLQRDIERGRSLTATEAVNYGLIDELR